MQWIPCSVVQWILIDCSEFHASWHNGSQLNAVDSRDMIFELTSRGITPVIAHPERNMGIQDDPDKLYDFVKMGCLTQLTSSSYLGIFGKHVQDLTEKIIKSNLGFVFASDAHNFKGRRFLMKEAFDKLEREEGSSRVNQFNLNAKNIINGVTVDDMDFEKISKRTTKKFWLF